MRLSPYSLWLSHPHYDQVLPCCFALAPEPPDPTMYLPSAPGSLGTGAVERGLGASSISYLEGAGG